MGLERPYGVRVSDGLSSWTLSPTGLRSNQLLLFVEIKPKHKGQACAYSHHNYGRVQLAASYEPDGATENKYDRGKQHGRIDRPTTHLYTGSAAGAVLIRD